MLPFLRNSKNDFLRSEFKPCLNPVDSFPFWLFEFLPWLNFSAWQPAAASVAHMLPVARIMWQEVYWNRSKWLHDWEPRNSEKRKKQGAHACAFAICIPSKVGNEEVPMEFIQIYVNLLNLIWFSFYCIDMLWPVVNLDCEQIQSSLAHKLHLFGANIKVRIPKIRWAKANGITTIRLPFVAFHFMFIMAKVLRVAFLCLCYLKRPEVRSLKWQKGWPSDFLLCIH